MKSQQIPNSSKNIIINSVSLIAWHVGTFKVNPGGITLMEKQSVKTSFSPQHSLTHAYLTPMEKNIPCQLSTVVSFHFVHVIVIPSGNWNLQHSVLFSMTNLDFITLT